MEKIGDKCHDIFYHPLFYKRLSDCKDKCLPYLFGYKTGLSLSRKSTNNQISPMQFCCNTGLPSLNNPKDLDPSYKTDLDF